MELKDIIFSEIPLFTNLTPYQHNLIKERVFIKEYKKDQIIYAQGSAADAFYCVILGRVVIYTKDKTGKENILEYLHRGKYFGIISLLTGEPHSVTAKALNDCTLLIIKKEDFDFILNKIPRLAIDLSRSLSRRLKRKDIHEKTIFESTIISIFSPSSQSGKTIYALNLALSLNQQTHKSIIILDIAPQETTHSLPNKLEITDYRVFDLTSSKEEILRINDYCIKNKFGIDLICLHYLPEAEACIQNIIEILSRLVNDYHYLILDLPSAMDQTIFRILNQSDLIHLLTSPQELDLLRTRNLIERLTKDFHFHEDKIKVIINEYKEAKLTHPQQKRLLGYEIFATLPKIELLSKERLVLEMPDYEYAKAIRRISRQVGDCLVGLVLGVGVAYGFCHIGVLRVFEEEHIPVDIISGSSIGAIIASLWAIGKSSDEILEIAKEFKEPKYIWSLIDLTFPIRGFIKGNKLYKFLKRYFGNKTFYDTRLPLKIIASDVKRKEPRVLDKGLLIDAIMASCCMPGVFRPFQLEEGILFDGGLVNPLPTEPLFRIGVKKIIAVNVTPSQEDILRQYEKLKEKGSFGLINQAQERKPFSLSQYLKNIFKTNILDIIFSSIEILQSEVAQKEAELADVVLHPDTSGLYWLELHRAEEFAKRGEEEARRNLDKIWRLINE